MRSASFIAFCVAALAACSPKAPATKASDVDIAIRISEAGAWQVDYRFSKGQPEVDLGPSLGDFRQTYWKSLDPAVLVVAREGRDYLRAADGRSAFRAASFDVEPASVDLHKDYEPFISMGDGGMLFYDGHVIPFDSAGERLDARLSLAPRVGEAVHALGASSTALENWKSPYNHPAFIYVGRGSVVDGGVLTTIADATAPDWISDEVSDFAPAIGAALADLLGGELPIKPTIFLVMGDRSAPGRLSYSGDALPGQYQMTLAGEAWSNQTPEALAVLRRSTAHEAAHLWQSAARPASNKVPDWIHEGGADALGAEAMVKAGYWSPAELASDLARARAVCADALQGASLRRAENDERWPAVYACGHVINVVAAGETGVADFWREFIRRSTPGGYDEAAFLALAEERAGAEKAKSIRDLILINEARPDRAISAMMD